MIVIYLNCTISNLYYWKFPLFIPSKDEILVKNTPTSLHEKKTEWWQWTLILILCLDVHVGLDLPSPRPHASIWPWPSPCGRHKWMASICKLHLVVWFPTLRWPRPLVPYSPVTSSAGSILFGDSARWFPTLRWACPMVFRSRSGRVTVKLLLLLNCHL